MLHPSHFSDLNRFEYLFSALKKSLVGKKFDSNDEVITAMQVYLANYQKMYFPDGLKKLEHR